MCYKDTDRDISLYYDEGKLMWYLKCGEEIAAEGATAVSCISNWSKKRKEEC